MSTPLYGQFVGECIRYINGQITLHELEEWYTPHMEELLDIDNSLSSKLVGEIEMGLHEIYVEKWKSQKKFKHSLSVFLLTQMYESIFMQKHSEETSSSAAIYTMHHDFGAFVVK